MKSGRDVFYIDEMQSFPMKVQLERVIPDPAARKPRDYEELLEVLEGALVDVVAKELRIDLI